MKLTTIFASQLAALSSANPHFARQYQTEDPHAWIPQGSNDFRGPCPMLNTLTNHGYLPRDGRNLTKVNVVKGLTTGLNFNASLASIMWEQAIIANPEPNATFFTLDQLNVHNVLEHDASMSREDAAFGNNHVFDKTLFDTTRQFWTADPVTAQMLADGKLYRQIVSRSINPNYTFTTTTEQFSLGEVAAPIIAFGDIDKFTVPKNLIEYFFLNEKLPFELGWTQKTHVMSLEDITKVSQAIGNATNLFTGGDAQAAKLRRGDFHAGMF
ncbi:Cloroperoxidase [Lophiostoma macrostomum CBS 122681]|uniref:Cloroperoxidase n=1 Tax=Lophiostoma macrostomum CBS 122681 TaxID=1314788 RepID=A0A6A6SGY4_9PLEO|nr:Cloroperoxidase [Lophiostoma macrostomum CBS 122681]